MNPTNNFDTKFNAQIQQLLDCPIEVFMSDKGINVKVASFLKDSSWHISNDPNANVDIIQVYDKLSERIKLIPKENQEVPASLKSDKLCADIETLKKFANLDRDLKIADSMDRDHSYGKIISLYGRKKQ